MMNQTQKNHLKKRILTIAETKCRDFGMCTEGKYTQHYETDQIKNYRQRLRRLAFKSHLDNLVMPTPTQLEVVLQKLNGETEYNYEPTSYRHRPYHSNQVASRSTDSHPDYKDVFSTIGLKLELKGINNECEALKEANLKMCETINRDAEAVIDQVMIGEEDDAMKFLKDFQDKEYKLDNDFLKEM
jgi:hypothetical protein